MIRKNLTEEEKEGIDLVEKSLTDGREEKEGNEMIRKKLDRR